MMTRLFPAMRVSLGLIMVVVSIIMVSDLLGIIPDRSTAVIDGRKRIAETLAVQYSLAARRSEYESIAASLNMLVERNDDVLSAALRSAGGDLLAVAGNHEDNWDYSYGDKSTPTQMQVPIYRDTNLLQKWGTVELRFRPANSVQLLGIEVSPLLGMTFFVAATGFLIFLLLIKNIFTNIDPSTVVPMRVRRALDTLTEGVLLIDNKGRILFVNAMFLSASGARERDLLGKAVDSLQWKIDGTALPWLKTQESGTSAVGEKLSLVIPGEADRHFTVNSSPVLDGKGERQGVMVTFDDVTELEARNDELRDMVNRLKESSEKINIQNEELRILATRDPLTNCKNRRLLFDQYEEVYANAISKQQEFCCLMLDIDFFKRINDGYGHAAGDQVLRRVAGTVKSVLRSNDEVFRYGGEEFCVLLPGAREADALALAERLREVIEACEIADAAEGNTIRVTSSLGVSSIRSGATTLSGLIEQADIALYQSKNTGRNRVTAWAAELQMPDSSGSKGERAEESSRCQETRTTAPQAAGQFLDHITGLPNRINFRERLAQSIVEAEESGAHIAVLLVDLDLFQRINNIFGYAYGDTVLNIVAKRLSESLRATDPVTRVSETTIERCVYGLGGDEFGILLNGLQEDGDVSIIVNRLASVLSDPYEIDGQSVHMTAGIGISLYPANGTDADTLVTRAGLALQQAKRSGKNGSQFFRDEYISNVQQDYELEKELRRAIEDKQFELYFQPQLDLVSLKIISMEALIRWHHPEKGMISPADFIPVAESSGLIVRIGQWVIESACRQIRGWLDAGMVLPVSVNISAIQLRQVDLVEQINSAVARARINPEYLELEITESTVMENMDFALETMQTLKRLGYRITIDDFGTGYSSLEYLKRFPVSNIKIDRSFIRHVDSDPDDAAIVRATISMAHGMGMKVVAEGVENEQQLFFLRNLRCDMVQGYLLGHPLPAGEAINLIDQKSRQLH